jgi:hypothetical protein
MRQTLAAWALVTGYAVAWCGIQGFGGYYVNILEAFGLVKRPTPAPTSTYAEAQAIISNIPVFGSVAGAAAGLLGPFLSWLP